MTRALANIIERYEVKSAPQPGAASSGVAIALNQHAEILVFTGLGECSFCAEGGRNPLASISAIERIALPNISRENVICVTSRQWWLLK